MHKNKLWLGAGILFITATLSPASATRRLNELQIYCHANSGPKHDILWPITAKRNFKSSDDFSYGIFRAFLKDPALTLPQKLKVSTKRNTIIAAAKKLYKNVNEDSNRRDIAFEGETFRKMVGDISGNPAKLIFFGD